MRPRSGTLWPLERAQSRISLALWPLLEEAEERRPRRVPVTLRPWPT